MADEQLPPLRIREADGSPNMIPVFDLILSDNLGIVQRGGGIAALIVTTGGGGAAGARYASTGGSYITFSAETDLTAERTLVAGMGIAFADSGANGNLVIHPNTTLLVTTGRTISAGAGLSGGGDLSADRTISLVTPVSVPSGGTGVSTIGSNALVYGAGTLPLISMPTLGSGSLIVGSGNNLPPHVLGVGSQGQMLISDSSKLGALAWVNSSGAGSSTTYASTGGSYITFSLETDLTAERNLVAGMGIVFADSGANSNLVLHPNTSLLVTTSRTISAGAGLSGGGNLSADRTISLVTPVSQTSGGTGVSGIPCCIVGIASDQIISPNVDTKINYGSVIQDTHSYYVTSSNRYRPLIPGLFMCGMAVRWSATEDTVRYRHAINFNGLTNFSGVMGNSGTSDRSFYALKLIRFNGTTDYFESNVEHAASTAQTLLSDADRTVMWVYWVGS